MVEPKEFTPTKAEMMKSSDNARQPASVRYPRMSPEMFEKLSDIRDLPAFFVLIYEDEKGKTQFWYELRTSFPKNKVLAGLYEVAASFKKRLLDRIMPQPGESRGNEMAELTAMVEAQKPK